MNVDSTAVETLLRQADSGATGCFATRDGSTGLRMYLLRGAPVAAEADDDALHYLRRVRLEGVLDQRTVASLVDAAQRRVPVFGRLLDSIPGDVLERLLKDRFVENVARFILYGGAATFSSSAAVFVDNLQLGFDAKTLLQQCSETLGRAGKMPPETEIARGTRPPDSDLEKRVWSVLDAPKKATSVIPTLPLEPIAARALLADLLAAGTIRGPEPAAPAAKRLSTPQAWLQPGVEPDEDMDAFADHDDEVRGQSRGAFSTRQRNLDRVEVAEPKKAAQKVRIQATFSAPGLTESEAREKIEVANDVLLAIRNAFEAANGDGSGNSTLQALLEGAPHRMAVLFENAGIDGAGRLGSQTIVRNLQRRPPSEHRRLLNDGLVDLIERGLSMAADELDESAVDSMLERAAGYRQRLGL